ncbi:hypothetical protein ABEB36_010614 [Hypothenemus hampei]|uniref:Transposable element P transposase-like RNase H C-terminal domain-containing protein n=1 Tax=Hypothenemus hampei TaxID=57062 RepID=A0ABD1EGT6_HYPHA
MKVSHCTQVFSDSVSRIVRILVRGHFRVETDTEILQLDESTMATSNLLKFLDSLFDSLNGNTKTFSADEAIFVLQTFKYVKNGTHVGTPSVQNLMKTIKNFKILHEILQNLGFEYTMTRNFNQDPLENFFGQIRIRNCRNINPTAAHFAISYKSLLISGFTKKTFGRCEL